MQATASITVSELCQLVADAAFAIEGLLVKHTGHDIYNEPASYAHYENIMPNLLDLHGQLTALCDELDTQDVMGNNVSVPNK